MTDRKPTTKSNRKSKPFIMAVFAASLLFTALLPGIEAKTHAADAIEFSEIMPLASKSLLLDVVLAGDKRLVAVGERGHVLLSDDKGVTWKQVRVPTRAMLTSVFFTDGRHGWAVGHDAVIIATINGGETWSVQYLALDKEQPLLDVLFLNSREGIAVGAYGLCLATRDGGKTWEEQTVDALDDPEFGMPHINTIIRDGSDSLYMAGEAGMLARSGDGGQTWESLPRPYNGSFFTLLPTRKGTLIAAGLRGNIFRSEDRGDTWERVKTDSQLSIMGSCQASDGSIVLVGLTGVVMTSRDDGRVFTTIQRPDRLSISQALPVEPGLVIAGEGGVLRIKN